MKQIHRENREIEGSSASIQDYPPETDSPTLKKHDTVFISLFEKEKSIDLARPKGLDLAKIRQPLGVKSFEQPKEFRYCFFENNSDGKDAEREFHSFEETETERIGSTLELDKEFKRELEQQIEQ